MRSWVQINAASANLTRSASCLQSATAFPAGIWCSAATLARRAARGSATAVTTARSG